MEKLETDQESKYFYGKRLYLNDINKIITIFKQREYCLKFYDEKFKFESIDDVIENLGCSPDILRIEGYPDPTKDDYSDYVEIDFYKSQITVHYMNKKDKNIFIFNEIVNLVEDHESSKLRIKSNSNSLLLKNKDEVEKEEVSFWKKNKHTIILLVIGSIITIFVQFLFKLIQYLWNLIF